MILGISDVEMRAYQREHEIIDEPGDPFAHHFSLTRFHLSCISCIRALRLEALKVSRPNALHDFMQCEPFVPSHR